MTTARLDGKRIAILATDGVEQTELVEPREMLLNAGATALLVSPRPGTITAFRHEQKGKEIQVDVPVASANAEAFDALVLPGGVFNADRIRASRYAVDFVRDFAALRRPIAAIGHAPWLLIEADEVHGRTLTSFPVAEDRPAQRRRDLGRPRRHGRRLADHQPAARRPARVLRPAGRRSRRRRAGRRRRRALAAAPSPSPFRVERALWKQRRSAAAVPQRSRPRVGAGRDAADFSIHASALR